MNTQPPIEPTISTRGSASKFHCSPRLRAASLLPLALLFALATAAHAQFQYVISGSEATITGYIGPGGDVVIPATIQNAPVQAIEGNAFATCTNLTSVIIPGAVQFLGGFAFTSCYSLTALYFQGNAPVAPRGVLSSSTSATVYRLAGSTGWSSTFAGQPVAVLPYTYTTTGTSVTITGYTGSGGAVSIPGVIAGLPVTRIQAFASSNTTVTSVTIPSGVTSIGNAAFMNCTNIASATIPSTVTALGTNAFDLDTGLTTIYFEGNAPAVSSGAFSGDTKATAYYLPGTTGWSASLGGIPSALLPYTYVTTGAITTGSAITITEYTGSATAITFPSVINSLPVTALGSGTSPFQSQFTSIVIPTSVTSIAAEAFLECYRLTGVTIPNSITTIGYDAFAGSGLTSVTIPSSVTDIVPYAFVGCAHLTSIIVASSNSNYSSANGVLFDKAETTLIQFPGGVSGNYTIPSGVSSIGLDAFSYSILTSVTIPGTVTTIGSEAFDSCTSLTGVNIPASVTSIGDNSYFNCTSVGAYTVDPGNPDYSSLNGVLFDKNQNTLIQYPCGATGIYVVPSTVTAIGDEAFTNCDGLTGVTFPEGLESIGLNSFAFCYGLATVTIPDTVGSIGGAAFEACGNLGSATFLGNAASVGAEAFVSVAGNFTVNYYNTATGFTSPTWTDSSGDTYPAINLGNSTISNWLVSYGYPFNANLQGTPNGDDVPLLMDYALNLDPTRNQSASIPLPVISGTQMSLTFHAGSAGVTYTVQTSTDLRNWSNSGVTTSAPDASNFSTATVPVSGASLFMRLMVAY